VIGGWNTDDTYDHTITWRVELTDREVAERLKVQQSMITRILQMLGIR
jgi:transcription initiation factor IIE alpha subunit